MEQVRRGRDSWARFTTDSENSVKISSVHHVPTDLSKNHENKSKEALIRVSVEKSTVENNVQSFVLNNTLFKDRFKAHSTSFHQSSNIDQWWNQHPTQLSNSNGLNVTSSSSAYYSHFSSPLDPNFYSYYLCENPLDPWAMTTHQKMYYLSQFLQLKPDSHGLLSGLQSKTYFELSKLPIYELSSIWDLADQDQDGYLCLGEFCVAMHLIILRRNGAPIPQQLPKSLLSVVHHLNAHATINTSLLKSQQSGSSDIVQDNSWNQFLSVPVENSTLKSEPQSRKALTQTTISSRCDSINSLENQHRSRHKSISSQSGIGSLTSESEVFKLQQFIDSCPTATSQLKYPIPRKVHTLPLTVQGTLCTSDGSHLSLLDSITVTSSYHPCDHSYVDLEAGQMTYLRGDAIAIQTDKILNSNDSQVSTHESVIPMDTPSSADNSVLLSSPPPPPPRAILAPPTIGWPEPTGSFGDRQPEYYGRIPSHDSTQISEESPRNENSLPNNQMDVRSTKLVNVLQAECDQIIRTNEKLTNTLINLQKDRIALKILLERLMPLDAS